MQQHTPELIQQPVPDTQSIWNVLCVDDETNVLRALKRLLNNTEFQFFPASNAREGMKLMQQHSIDIVISDMRMPEIDGAEFLAKIAREYPSSYRMLLTGYADNDATISAVNDGQIHRYLQKPWNNEDLLLTLSQAAERLCLEREKQQLLTTIKQQNQTLHDLNLELEERVQLRTRQIRQAMTRVEQANSQIKTNHRATLKVFYNLISLNPHLGGKQAIQISELCELIARHLELTPSEVTTIHLAGLISELGLLSLPEKILALPLCKLSSTETKLFLEHPVKAYIALAPAENLNDVAEIIKYQYEQVCGAGTPDGLLENQIPLGARILSVARDYVHSINGKRYDICKSSHDTLRQLNRDSGTIYDKQIVQLLPELIPQLEHKALKSSERLVTSMQLEAGMELSRSIYNQNEILLLPAGHRFTASTLERLQSLEKIDGRRHLPIYVLEQ
ncbi:Response regulator c-di-GMP phosphodiesterase, RpfG family, contains REC and HD-GYP domains [Amphritea atlantica]|uniref:Response regulator c-di-GMP phosphodiesterase, RpfG family, contains REC and HD-GYP domains n=1 Tax=Amphritea atlantica TaxID=355243 RepID=A0A1H9IY57_9GAMM|nr:HD domain-containing phosphohydrolase [Amphritea atlantica]SEQ79437.1 Response regulator c-di-GMP phosphodiesterase, RpfG family, contains REC and HD-GYP domains [Amphritea atlantica]